MDHLNRIGHDKLPFTSMIIKESLNRMLTHLKNNGGRLNVLRMLTIKYHSILLHAVLKSNKIIAQSFDHRL